MAKKKRRQKGQSQQDSAPRAPRRPLTPEMVQTIETWADEAAEAEGLVIFDVEVTGSWVIRAFIDRPGAIEPGQGVTVDQCVSVSRYLEALLDVEDGVPEDYTLEVSSPGVERPLTKWRQFPLVVGRTVKVVLREPIDGQNVYEGELVAAKDDVISIRPKDTDPQELGWDNVARARLTYAF